MNEYLPLRDVVFNTLRQAILKGELAPGERLMEIQLAEKLGVSRTPIREAIRKLELEGLVLMIPRKGAEVAKISEKSLRDVLEVRRSLEELAIELACQRMTDEEIEQLGERQNDFKNAINKGNAMNIAETDEAFQRQNSTNENRFMFLDPPLVFVTLILCISQLSSTGTKAVCSMRITVDAIFT